jgi:hypothetical protein
MLCPECRLDNPPGARFCGRCGAAMRGAGRPPTKTKGHDLWSPVLLAVAIGFFVWTSVLQATGRHLVALGLGASAALIMIRLGTARPASHA